MNAEVRLSAMQVHELELARAGCYDAVAYALPGDTALMPTLRLRGRGGAAVVDLLDSEATPVARVSVAAAQLDGDMEWIAGPIDFLRATAPAAHADLRPGADAPRFPHALLVGAGAHVPTTTGGAVVVIDSGDAHDLSRALQRLATNGVPAAILPEPAAQHLEGDSRERVLAELARRAFADTVEVARSAAVGSRDGVVVLLTGLSGSGKSTIARALAEDLRATQQRRVTLLDGDEVRAMLSSELGFSRDDRILNIRRIGWVAALVAAHGGIAICAPIAPYATMRAEMRQMAERHGRFVLVHVATPLEVCEARDRKGLYAKARTGRIAEFTGISDPYEEPANPDLVVDTTDEGAREAAIRIRHLLDGGGHSYVI